jgi:hypothetical protein
MTFPRNLTRTAVRAERVLVRAPLRSIDRMVVPLFGPESLAHRSLVRGVQTLDAAVDRLAGERRPIDEPAADAVADERTEIAERAEHYLEAQEDEVFVGELADEDLRRAQAEVRAKQEIEDEQAR